jgi:hypothetical protein
MSEEESRGMTETTEKPVYSAPPRRYKILTLTDHQLFTIFQSMNGAHVLRIEGLPEHYYFAGFQSNFFRGGIDVLVGSDEFEEIPAGAEYPRIGIDMIHFHCEEAWKGHVLERQQNAGELCE